MLEAGSARRSLLFEALATGPHVGLLDDDELGVLIRWVDLGATFVGER